MAADLVAITAVWLGDAALDEALRSHKVRLIGPAQTATRITRVAR